MYKGLIKTDSYTYKIIVNTSEKIVNGKSTVYSRYFNIGSYVTDDNEKKTCVDIHVMYPDSQKVLPFINYKLAKLITTHYNERCSVNEKLERSEGTKHMINTALYLVSKMCPFVEGFELNDASTRLCDNNTTITLSYFSITNYGKTWYEKNFNAYIEDKIKSANYKQTIHTLLATNLSDWDTFRIMFLRDTEKDVQSHLESIYKASRTYEDFFKNIHKIGISKSCVYMQPWIDNLMLTTDLRNYILFTQWVIPVKSIKHIKIVNYTTEHSISGGKQRKSRKRN